MLAGRLKHSRCGTFGTFGWCETNAVCVCSEITAKARGYEDRGSPMPLFARRARALIRPQRRGPALFRPANQVVGFGGLVLGQSHYDHSHHYGRNTLFAWMTAEVMAGNATPVLFHHPSAPRRPHRSFCSGSHTRLIRHQITRAADVQISKNGIGDFVRSFKTTCPPIWDRREFNGRT